MPTLCLNVWCLQVKDFKYVGSQRQTNGNAIVIRDGKAAQQAGDVSDADAQLAADEEFARQMQAKEDARARQRCALARCLARCLS